MSAFRPPLPVNGVLPAAPADAADGDSAAALGLFQRMATEDTAAMNELYALFAPALFAAALRTLDDHGEAEDVLQETFVRLWRKAPQYDAGRSAPFTFAWMILRGLCHDRLRSRQRRTRRVLTVMERDPEPQVSHPGILPREEMQRLHAALAMLPGPEREAVEMAVFLEYTGEETAHHLQQPLGTVKSRIRRGLARLRQTLSRHD